MTAYFNNFIGNKRITELLGQAFNNQKISQAYLFLGPVSVGKKTLAKKFIQGLFCQKSPAYLPCEKCAPCQQVSKEIHPDVTWVQKDDSKRNIAIEQIRNLISQLNQTAFLGGYKVGVVTEADSLSIGAANALLKTLEEPTNKTLLILTAHNLASLPKTIISRVQILKFYPVPQLEIKKWLDKNFPEEKETALASFLAQGSPGRGYRMLKDKNTIISIKEKSKVFLDLMPGSLNERFAYVDRLVASKKEKESENMRQEILALINIWQIVVRDLALMKFGFYDRIINVQEENRLKRMAEATSVKKIVVINNCLNFTRGLLSSNVNQKLALDNLFLHI